jgi:hypothetical protein
MKPKPKSLQINPRIHLRLKKMAVAQNVLVSRLAEEFLTFAMDAKRKEAK